jgi:hypothetical protein
MTYSGTARNTQTHRQCKQEVEQLRVVCFLKLFILATAWPSSTSQWALLIPMEVVNRYLGLDPGPWPIPKMTHSAWVLTTKNTTTSTSKKRGARQHVLIAVKDLTNCWWICLGSDSKVSWGYATATPSPIRRSPSLSAPLSLFLLLRPRVWSQH